METKKIKAVIWDWNGTLFNDVVHSIKCINKMLISRKLPLLTVDEYRNVFTFPVKEYYTAIGFDFTLEAWEEVALEFMNHYWDGMNDVPLFADTEWCLGFLQSKGVKQFIVSAMEHEDLVALIEKKGIAGYFKRVMGIHNHFGEGKKHLAAGLLMSEKLNPDEIVWIGDTIHDHEVALEVNIASRLVLTGHQHQRILAGAGAPFYATLTECVTSFSF
jgi:phosphoglycolate phosphatase